MKESFAEILAVGGKSNSLGRASEVLDIVLHDKSRLDELYDCLFEDDAWLRMRAADTFEKVCREHPDWISTYIDKISAELAASTQASIQWHLAQIYRQVNLTPVQKRFAIQWLNDLLSTTQVDWIVSVNSMVTLVQFTRDGSFSVGDMVPLLQLQQHHRSKSVVKRANKLLAEINNAS